MFAGYDTQENRFYNVRMIDFQRNCFSLETIHIKTWIDLEFDIDPYMGRYILLFNNKKVKSLTKDGFIHIQEDIEWKMQD